MSIEVVLALVQAAHEDGTPFLLSEVAIGKAYTATAFGRTSAEVADVFDGRAQFTTSISVATGGRVMLGKGGLPIIEDGVVTEGIGASGGHRRPGPRRCRGCCRNGVG